MTAKKTPTQVEEAEAALAKARAELAEVQEAAEEVEQRIKLAEAKLHGAAFLDRLQLRDAIEADQRLGERIGDERERVEDAVEAAEQEVHRAGLQIELAEVEPQLDGEIRQLWQQAYKIDEQLERVRDLGEQRNNLLKGMKRPPAPLFESISVGFNPDEGDRRRIEITTDAGFAPTLGPDPAEPE